MPSTTGPSKAANVGEEKLAAAAAGRVRPEFPHQGGAGRVVPKAQSIVLVQAPPAILNTFPIIVWSSAAAKVSIVEQDASSARPRQMQRNCVVSEGNGGTFPGARTGATQDVLSRSTIGSSRFLTQCRAPLRHQYARHLVAHRAAGPPSNRASIKSNVASSGGSVGQACRHRLRPISARAAHANPGPGRHRPRLSPWRLARTVKPVPAEVAQKTCAAALGTAGCLNYRVDILCRTSGSICAMNAVSLCCCRK